jgi:hypothetical protein
MCGELKANTDPMKPTDLRTAFCAQTRCAASAFERTFFWRGLYRHAVPLAFCLRILAPRFFREDEEFIRWIGRDGSLTEVEADIERFRYSNRVRPHWLRTGLRIHLDPVRIWAWAQRCLAG